MSTLFGELAGNDAYEILGIRPDATADEIHQAWRELASAHHPDRVTGSAAKTEAEDRLRLVNAARDVLTAQRSAYDAAHRDSAAQDPAPEADPAPPPPPGKGRGRRAAGISGAIFIAGLLILVLGVAVVRGTGLGEPPTDTPVPADLAGTWTGTGEEQFGKYTSWHVELALEEGRRLGEVQYKHGFCTGTAVPVAYDGESLTVETDFPEEGPDCDVGPLTLTPRAGREVGVVYYLADGVEKATGVLHRP